MSPCMASCLVGTLAINGPADAVLGLLISFSIMGRDGSGQNLDPVLREQLNLWSLQAQSEKTNLLSKGVPTPDDFKPAIKLLALLLNGDLSSTDRQILEFELEVLKRRQKQVDDLLAELSNPEAGDVA